MDRKSVLRSGGQALIVFASFAVVAACSSNAGDTPTPSPGTAADGGVDWYAKLGVQPPSPFLADGGPSPVSFDYSKVPAPYADAAGCKAFPSSVPTAQRDCMCDNCFNLVQQCDALDHCIKIVECGARTGCVDANTCYLAPAKTAADPDGLGCIAETDAAGNGSVSAALSLNISACVTQNSCR